MQANANRQIHRFIGSAAVFTNGSLKAILTGTLCKKQEEMPGVCR